MCILGQQDGLMGRGTCTQVLLFKFNIYIPQGGRRESVLNNCALTFTCIP